MRVALLLLVCVAGQMARLLEDDVALFKDFQVTYGRQYTVMEEDHRFSCFRRNLALIDERNARGAERHGINQFADLCPAEFKESHHNLAFKPRNSSTPTLSFPAPSAGSVDWRTKGAVTPIKNQGMCGSCWAFAPIANIEALWFLAGNTLVGLSEQELVSCSHNGNMGCNGGLPDDAFKWIIQNGGIDSESDYPYTSGGGTTGTCTTSKLSKDVAKISSYHDITPNEDDIATAVASIGPVSAAVDAESGWQTYSGGIMKNCHGTQLDHGTTIIGYGTEGSTPYWILKNMWGTSWGENGYIRIEKGTNQCGIKQMPSTAKV